MTENFHYSKEYIVGLLRELQIDIQEHCWEYQHVTPTALREKLAKTIKNETES